MKDTTPFVRSFDHDPLDRRATIVSWSGEWFMRHVRRGARGFPLLVALGALIGCAGKKAAPAPSPAVTPPTAGAARPSASVAASSDSVTVTNPSISIPAVPQGRIDRQLLTRDAILATQYTNLYDVIFALRGNWLRGRTAESIQGKSATVQIYLDNQRLAGGADELRSIASTNISTVRYYDPIQASARWGMDHGAGAIYILTSKR